jgi:hypothetical protein
VLPIEAIVGTLFLIVLIGWIKLRSQGKARHQPFAAWHFRSSAYFAKDPDLADQPSSWESETNGNKEELINAHIDKICK